MPCFLGTSAEDFTSSTSVSVGTSSSIFGFGETRPFLPTTGTEGRFGLIAGAFGFSSTSTFSSIVYQLSTVEDESVTSTFVSKFISYTFFSRLLIETTSKR